MCSKKLEDGVVIYIVKATDVECEIKMKNSKTPDVPVITAETFTNPEKFKKIVGEVKHFKMSREEQRKLMEKIDLDYDLDDDD